MNDRAPISMAMLRDVAAIRREFPIFGRPHFHYLDSAATAQAPACVIEAMRDFEINHRANVYGGVYQLARDSLAAYERARSDIAAFLGAASPSEIVFTYGTTSSINLLAHSFGMQLVAGDEILVSGLEHHSNLLPWQALVESRGVRLRVLPVTEEGRLDLTRLGDCVRERCRLVALTHCSNVTGAVTDVAPIVAAARAVGARVLIDGAQRVPHAPLDVAGLGIDFYAFSGHKAYGPTGVGVLWGREALLASMPPFMRGGQMIRAVTLEAAEFADPPRRFEAGTPPIAAVLGLGAAIRWMRRLDWQYVAREERRLAGRILAALRSLPGVRILGPASTDDRSGVISFVLRGMSAEAICRQLDASGVMLRHGHHCAQPLARFFGVEGSARASLGPYNDDADVDAFIAALAALVEAPRAP
jgi:cysteine desulfurase / selenocysteine lyase